MLIPHPIPYQGSKRNISRSILSFFPTNISTFIEPFAGSAAMTIAAAYYKRANKFHINDINKPLINLWNLIINHPSSIAEDYKRLWNKQLGNERAFYDYIRCRFNDTKRADYFLYLLARCVKASIRYNTNGEFNQSPDNRRKGRKPENMRKDILKVSHLLKSKINFSNMDYKEVLSTITDNDLVYMDPPYQGVCNGKDPRYYDYVDFDEFVHQLRLLVKRNISFIVSYDGRRGDYKYGKELPKDIAFKVEVNAGRSTQSTLLGQSHLTYESLYISEALMKKLQLNVTNLQYQINNNNNQLSMI